MLWNNTSLIFVASVSISLVVVVVSWFMGRTSSLQRSPGTQGGEDKALKEGIEEEEEKDKDEFDQEKKVIVIIIVVVQ